MVKKQKSGLPGLSSAHTIEDRRWVPLGEDVRMAQDMAARGFRIMCRERGDHVELVPLELGLSAEALTKYFSTHGTPICFRPTQGWRRTINCASKSGSKSRKKPSSGHRLRLRLGLASPSCVGSLKSPKKSMLSIQQGSLFKPTEV